MTHEQEVRIEELVDGLNPTDPSTIALREAATARPIPAIEKPLGPREPEIIQEADGTINGISLSHQIAWGKMLEKDAWRS